MAAGNKQNTILSAVHGGAGVGIATPPPSKGAFEIEDALGPLYERYMSADRDRDSLSDAEWGLVNQAITQFARNAVAIAATKNTIPPSTHEQLQESVAHELMVKFLRGNLNAEGHMAQFMRIVSKLQTIDCLRRIKSVAAATASSSSLVLGGTESSHWDQHKLGSLIDRAVAKGGGEIESVGVRFSHVSRHMPPWRFAEYAGVQELVLMMLLVSGDYPPPDLLYYVPRAERRAVANAAIVGINVALESLESSMAA